MRRLGVFARLAATIDGMRSPGLGSVRTTALAVIAFGTAMGYLEAVVVVYLRAAIGLVEAIDVPVIEPSRFEAFATIESARELATLVMIAVVGWLAGRSTLERLAWAAVVFGTWDIVYYVGLTLTIGWPVTLGTWDVLFLVPAPWVGPVWAPLAVSAALVVFGLAAASRLRMGLRVHAGPLEITLALAGGALVVLSFLLDADRVIDGDGSPWTGWPVFWLGMAAAFVAAMAALAGGLKIALGRRAT
jgi:hypothetical protein